KGASSMLSNFLAVAVHNLARHKAFSGLGILGLALGLCAALCASLVLRDQLSYDRFIDGYERTYLAVAVLIPQGRAPLYTAQTHNRAAALLEARFPQIESVTRIAAQSAAVSHDEVEAKETL